MRLIKPLQIRAEHALVGLMSPSGRVEDSSQPAGEPAPSHRSSAIPGARLESINVAEKDCE
jgi:hypothetical protein